MISPVWPLSMRRPAVLPSNVLPLIAPTRRHPKKGAWADWGLRRASARRRHEIAKGREASEAGAAD